MHSAYLNIIFFLHVLKHNTCKYVEIKKFSKIDIKQNNVSAIIFIIKFLVYQWDPRHSQKRSRCLHFCLNNEVTNIAPYKICTK